MKVTVGDNEYPLPLDFTYDESNLMKRVTGLHAGLIWVALEENDPAAAVAIAAVAVKRDEPEVTVSELTERLMGGRLGVVRLDFRTAGTGADGDPPAEAAEAADE